MKLKGVKRGIVYRTGVECIGKRKGYFIFHNKIRDKYGAVKDEGQITVHPPHCDFYFLESLIKLIEKDS